MFCCVCVCIRYEKACTRFDYFISSRIWTWPAVGSDGVKDTDGKAKDINHEAKTKAKDLTPKAKVKDTRPRTYTINPKVCAMATFPCGGTSRQRARTGTPGL